MNIKLIKYAITITVIACTLLYYFMSNSFMSNSIDWRINDAATFYIQIPYDEVNDYLFEVENRLSAYPEWILTVFHGGLTQFEKQYYPYILPIKDSKRFLIRSYEFLDIRNESGILPRLNFIRN